MEHPNKGNMTVEMLIERLKDFNPKAEIKIAIKQYNKVHAPVVLPIKSSYTTLLERELTPKDFPVDHTYGGSITIHLPDGVIFSGLNKIK